MFNTLPTRFRHYEVQKLLGSGGFGAVYLARDTDLKRLVVLKTLHPHLAAQPEMVRRFLREAQTMARLDHTNIVRVNRVDAADDTKLPFFEMEYVEGQTLTNYRGTRILSLPEAIPLLKQIAAALDTAHQQGIIHRDIKPDNVLIKPNGTIKLSDFGIIKLLEATGTTHPSTGGIIGTPSYMAPEQVDINRRHEIGPPTDIYALGVVAYELLTGSLPFSGGHPQAILYAHANTPPPNPRTLNPDLSDSVAQVLLKALAKQPTQRYPTAMAFVEALNALTSLANSGHHQLKTSQIALNSTTHPSSPPSSISASGGHPTSVVPVSSASSSTPTSQPMISKPIVVGIIVLLLSIIIGGVLREFLSTLAKPEQESTQTSATSTMSGQDGMTLLYVPAGEFLRGSKEDDIHAQSQELPQRSIYLDAFWIDQTEISNEMFRHFVDETGYQTDAQKQGKGRVCADNRNCNETEGANWLHPQGQNSSVEGLEKHPVVQISWNDAKAYCEWSGRRLPTEAEWEKAARGTDGRIYPWGNQKIADNQANFCEKNCLSNWANQNIDDSYELTAPIDAYSDSASPYGALNMAGNVWEWTADSYNPDYYRDAPKRNPPGPPPNKLKVLRGGSWYNDVAQIRATNRDGLDPTIRYDDNGFRCAASP